MNPQFEIDFTREWKDIHGSPGYQVSNDGLVKSIERTFKTIEGETTRRRGRLLKQINNGKDYLSVTMPSKRRIYVHRLVAMAFIPNPENLPHVNHKDLNKKNNHVSNLEWVSRSGNIRHAMESGVKIGMSLPGEKNGNRKLSNQDVIDIRNLKNIKTPKEIAAMYNITFGHVYQILRNFRWSHEITASK